MPYSKVEQLDGVDFFVNVERTWIVTVRQEAGLPLSSEDLARFQTAQEEILAVLLSLERLRKTVQSSPTATTNHSLALLSRAERLYRRAADAIAWELPDGQLWVARRLFTDERRPSLLHSNCESAMEVSRHLRDQEHSLALVSHQVAVRADGHPQVAVSHELLHCNGIRCWSG